MEECNTYVYVCNHYGLVCYLYNANYAARSIVFNGALSRRNYMLYGTDKQPAVHMQ